ncbi:MAG: nuclear transport factor 2 family protein [Rhodoferax sp.]
MSTGQPSSPGAGEPHVARVVAFFESLTPASLEQLAGLYARTARFVDPFNDVQGLPAVEGIFRHMFEALEEPRFVVTGQVVQGAQCFLLWDFHFRFKRFDRHTVQTIRGTSHLVFSDTGLVVLHRDYWDAAQELYEKLPLIGGLMRWLKKRANT